MSDLVQTPANVRLISGPSETQKTAQAITAGMPVYRDSASGSRLRPARANAADTDEIYGIALNSAPGEDQPIQIGLPGAVLDLGGTLSVGKLYGLSAAAAGGIAPVDDIDTSTYVTFLGGATATNRFIFQPLTLGVLAAAVVA